MALLAIVPGFLGLLSLLFGLLGGIWCNFVQIYAYLYAGNQLITMGFPKFGIYSYQGFEVLGATGTPSEGWTVWVQNSCFRYPEGTESIRTGDAPWNGAAICQIVAWAVASILILILFVSSCSGKASANLYRCAGAVFVFVVVPLQSMSFLLHSSNLCLDNPLLREAAISLEGTEDDLGRPIRLEYDRWCYFSSGGIIVMLSIIGFFLTGLLCCCIVTTTGAGGGQPGGGSNDAPAGGDAEAPPPDDSNKPEPPQEQPEEPSSPSSPQNAAGTTSGEPAPTTVQEEKGAVPAPTSFEAHTTGGGDGGGGGGGGGGGDGAGGGGGGE